jgi:hypothetical protein
MCEVPKGARRPSGGAVDRRRVLGRIRPGSSTSPRSGSASPRRYTVDSEIPVALTTAAIPPRPAE